MNLLNNVPFGASANPSGAAPPQRHMSGRVPKDFIEAMKRIPVKAADDPATEPPEKPAMTGPAKKRTSKSSACKWKSSFKPLGEGEEEEDGDEDGDEDGVSLDSSTSTSGKVELYNPYQTESSDSDMEVCSDSSSDQEQKQDQDHDRDRVQDQDQDQDQDQGQDQDQDQDQDQEQDQDQDNNLERLRLSPGRGGHDGRRWDVSYAEPGSRLFDRHDLSPEPRARESSGLRRALSPPTEPLDRAGYGSRGRPLDHRVRSPDRIGHSPDRFGRSPDMFGRSPDMFGCSPSTQEFPASYRRRETNGEERMRGPEHRRETSPTRFQYDYQHQMGPMEKDLDRIPSATERTRNRSKHMIIDNRDPISCDLCCVQLANGQELEDHLDTRSHWDTLAYIQQNNDYDDLSIAFLQDVLLYKSGQCSRAIEDTSLQALQENDHMTKVEMFHCAACNFLVATSASAVQSHVTSQEHLSNAEEFEAQQRRSCLVKAGTIINELKPQFEDFIKGDNNTSECWK